MPSRAIESFEGDASNARERFQFQDQDRSLSRCGAVVLLLRYLYAALPQLSERWLALQRINEAESKYKLCRVNKLYISGKKIPCLSTHDGRTIRYPDPLVKVNDTVKVDLATGTIIEIFKFETGQLCTPTKGKNAGRVGEMVGIEKHPGSFDIVSLKDATGVTFSTRLENIFVIGSGTKAAVSMPKGKGIKLNIIQERDAREAKAAQK